MMDDSLREAQLREMFRRLYRLALDERFHGSVTLHFEHGLLGDYDTNMKTRLDLVADGRK